MDCSGINSNAHREDPTRAQVTRGYKRLPHGFPTLVTIFLVLILSDLSRQPVRAGDEPRQQASNTASEDVAEDAPETASQPDVATDAVNAKTSEAAEPSLEKIELSAAEWRRRLSRNQFAVLRQHKTERAFKNKYWNNKREGIYRCAGCELPLFASDTKFESKTGWPSFYAPISEKYVGTMQDRSFFQVRTEVHCIRCGGHLGHVFPDGPRPTGLRYCINSAALEFEDGKKD